MVASIERYLARTVMEATKMLPSMIESAFGDAIKGEDDSDEEATHKELKT